MELLKSIKMLYDLLFDKKKQKQIRNLRRKGEKWGKLKGTLTITKGFEIKYSNYSALMLVPKTFFLLLSLAQMILIVYLGILKFMMHTFEGLKNDFGYEMFTGFWYFMTCSITGICLFTLGKNVWYEFEKVKINNEFYVLATMTILSSAIYFILNSFSNLNV